MLKVTATRVAPRPEHPVARQDRAQPLHGTLRLDPLPPPPTDPDLLRLQQLEMLRESDAPLPPPAEAPCDEPAATPHDTRPGQGSAERLAQLLERDLRSGLLSGAANAPWRHRRTDEVIRAHMADLAGRERPVSDDETLAVLDRCVDLHERAGDGRESRDMTDICLRAFKIHARRAISMQFVHEQVSGERIVVRVGRPAVARRTDAVAGLKAAAMFHLAQQWCPGRLVIDFAASELFRLKCLYESPSFEPDAITRRECARLRQAGEQGVSLIDEKQLMRACDALEERFRREDLAQREQEASHMADLLDAEYESRRAGEPNAPMEFQGRTNATVQAYFDVWTGRRWELTDAEEFALLRKCLELHERAFGSLLVPAGHPIRAMSRAAHGFYQAQADADPLCFLRFRYLQSVLRRQAMVVDVARVPIGPDVRTSSQVEPGVLTQGELRWLQTEDGRGEPLLRAIGDRFRQAALASAVPTSPLAALAGRYADENTPHEPTGVEERHRYASGMVKLLREALPTGGVTPADHAVKDLAETTLLALHDLLQVFRDATTTRDYLLLKANQKKDAPAIEALLAGDPATITAMSRRRELSLLHKYLDLHERVFGQAALAVRPEQHVYFKAERAFELHLREASRDATEYLRAGLQLPLLDKHRIVASQLQAHANAWLDTRCPPVDAARPLDISRLTSEELHRLSNDGMTVWFQSEFLETARKSAAMPAAQALD